MNIPQSNVVYFSPTGTSKKIAYSIASSMTKGSPAEYDLTHSNNTKFSIKEGGITVVSMPVYAGRLPETAVARLEHLQGYDSFAVAVVVYGNREFEDALLELKNLLIAKGFKVIAGGAFIGEHSYSTDEFPIAKGRPDSQDLAFANEFGKKICKKFNSDIDEIQVPGDIPYKEGMKRAGFLGPANNSSGIITPNSIRNKETTVSVLFFIKTQLRKIYSLSRLHSLNH